MIQDINSFAQYTDIHYCLTMQQGACLVDDPVLDINILQDRARIACKMQRRSGKMYVLQRGFAAGSAQ